MASSNVEYYEKQKDLHDSIVENEQKRKQLEAQLQAYSRSDHKLAKLRAVKLQSYWKRICEDERRSKQRNAQLLRDLDRMEANMASLEARREKLRHMKQQYFDYIERTYPKWLELVQQKKQEYIQQQRQKEEEQFHYQQQQQQQHYEQQQQQQQQQQQHFQQQQYEQQQQQQHQSLLQQQQFSGSQGYDSRLQYGQPPASQKYTGEQETSRKHQEAYLAQQHYDDHDRDAESPPPPLPSRPPPSSAYSGPEREYTNLKNIRRESEVLPPSQPQSVTVHMPSAQRDAVSPAKSGRPGSGRRSEQSNQNWVAAERDASIHSVSYSEETEVQPPVVQSVTVRQKTEPPKSAVQMMEPVSDEDVSDFGDEPDLPSGAGAPEGKVEELKPPSPVQAVHEHEVDEEEGDDDDTDQSPSVVHPDISMTGLFRLLKFVEEELMDALALEGFYRTRNPDETTRKDIIYKANSPNSTLQSLDAELVSMVILQQLTLVVRRLPGACMLSDTMLVRGANKLSADEVRSNLHRDALTLWDKLLGHFILLVKNRVMGTREVAHVFVPCLVHSGSDHQAKAVSVIEGVIESMIEKADGKSSPLPQDSITIDTARSSQQGGVPPLKFGSLVDSKPFSDEESSMITQSMSMDVQKVPLNETDAYRNLISGTRPPVRTMSHDDTDNSDNELEKQIASTLSPRSHGSKPHPENSNEVPFSAPRDESHDLSHDQEPQSELSSPSAPPVYVPTGVEQSTAKSVLGSTGGSSQQRKLAGMISSDLDTDTEVDIEHMVQKKEEDDDDFYDFYG